MLDETDGPDERDAATVRMLGFYLHSTCAAIRLSNPDRRLHGPVPLAAGVVPVSPTGTEQAVVWLIAELPCLHALLGRTVHGGYLTFGWQLTSALFAFRARSGDYERAIGYRAAAVRADR